MPVEAVGQVRQGDQVVIDSVLGCGQCSCINTMKVPRATCEIKQKDIAIWTGVEGNGCIHDGDGGIGRGLTMDIAKSLSICERRCDACIAHFDIKASEQEGEGIN